MREIKFRAWNKKNKRMFKVLSLSLSCLGKGHGLYDIKEDGLLIDKNIDDYIICEYTGLKDKNGKEIYEGDIVKQENTAVAYKDHERWMIGAVVYNECTFDVSYNYPYYADWPSERFEDVEVIGNIYENPELLTSSK